jgi:hypothetical protein
MEARRKAEAEYAMMGGREDGRVQGGLCRLPFPTLRCEELDDK